MTIAAVQITLPWRITTPHGPASTNKLYVDTGTIPLTDLSATPITAAVATLYADGLENIWSNILTGDGVVKVYDLSDAPPRVPVREAFFTFTPNTALPSIPTEVACNVSYRANYEAGASRRQFRGRTQLGPITAGSPPGASFASSTTTDGLFDSDLVDQVAAAFQDFGQTIGATDDYAWVCGSVAKGWKPVDLVTVTSECGTVRRRQNAADYTATLTV